MRTEFQTLNPEVPGPSTTEVDEVTKVLRKARALIEQGWTKGFFTREEPWRWPGARSYCTLGALYQAGGGYPIPFHTGFALDAGKNHELLLKASARLAAHLPGTMGPNPVTRLMFYNDHVATDSQQILALFDKALA